MSFKKTISIRNLLSQFLPIVGIIGFSAHFTAHAADTPMLPKAADIQKTSPSAEPSASAPSATIVPEEPNPTEAVAGGIGKAGIKPPDYAVLPTGKTLPEGIFRAQFITANTFGNTGFDASGKKDHYGIDYNRWMAGTQVEYGLTKTVSIGVGIPYVISNHATMDGNTFRSTEFYNKYYNEAVYQLAKVLSNSPLASLCGGSTASCIDYINQGHALPTTIILPTGERKTLDSSSIKSQLSNLIVGAGTPSNGANGLGDIQFGVLWNVISEESPIRQVPLYFSIGAGLRLPTGQFDLPSALRATGGDGTLITGGGTYDAIGRWNLDYVAMPGVILSWQHQMEYSLTSANLGRSSMLDPTQKNSADPITPQAVGPLSVPGDGVGNTLKFTRKGVHEIGFLQAAWGVGNVSQKMKWLGLYTQAKYNIAAQAYLNDMPIYAMADQFYLNESSVHPDEAYEQFYSAVLGTKFSGLPYMIPVELAAEFEYPLYGKNRITSPMNAQASLSVYF